MKLVLVFIVLSSFIFAQQNPPKTVKYVDLKKYVGLWYEVAKIPNSFQDQCVKNTTAKYTLTEDGEVDDANGVVRVVDTKSNAKLEVSFVSFLGWRPFWGDYWIIGLDENYQWAIVGTPNRKYGWVLSRTPNLDNTTMNKIFEIIKDQGYDPKKFEISQ
jgi:apolipoprotein D and lipocalin family protein